MQLSAAREAAAARLADQRAQADRTLRAAERAHADEAEALTASERATHAALRAGLVRDAQVVFRPLVSRWRDEPSRALATQIFEALVTLVPRVGGAGPCVASPAGFEPEFYPISLSPGMSRTCKEFGQNLE